MNARLAHSLAALAVAASGVASTAAFADGPALLINTGSGWVQTSAAPLFSVGQIVPGWAQTSTFEIRSTASSAGALYLAANDITEYENGCTPPEALVDTTCGPTQGELGHDLRFSVFLDPQNDGTFQAVPAWNGSLYDITTPILLSGDMPAGGTWGVRVDASLPITTGNETQSDRVDFDFALTLSGEGAGSSNGGSAGSSPSTGPETQAPTGPGSVEVKGIKVTKPQHGLLPAMTGELPFTGASADGLLTTALWLAAAGSVICVVTRARRRRRLAG